MQLIANMDSKINDICKLMCNIVSDKIYAQMIDGNFKIIIDVLRNIDPNVVNLYLQFLNQAGNICKTNKPSIAIKFIFIVNNLNRSPHMINANNMEIIIDIVNHVVRINDFIDKELFENNHQVSTKFREYIMSFRDAIISVINKGINDICVLNDVIVKLSNICELYDLNSLFYNKSIYDILEIIIIDAKYSNFVDISCLLDKALFLRED